MNRKALLSSATAEWATPQPLFDQLHKEFDFDRDAAAKKSTSKCINYFGPDHWLPSCRDALAAEHWGYGCNIFCNPPYGRSIGKWMQRAWEECQGRGSTVVMLVPARVGTKWWAKWVKGKASEVRFIEGRVKFIREDGLQESAPFDSAVVIYRPQLGPYKWASYVP